MKVLREEFYFEPRCIETGKIRWYGETYQNAALLKYDECTVYVRDNGEELYVYKRENDLDSTERKIKAVFDLVCKIKKYNNKRVYGRKNA